MEISGIANVASLYGTSAISERIATASQKPLERLSQQAESTRVQLSAFGQVKSATAQVEAAASKLQDKQNLATADDAAKAAQGFADAINKRLSLARQQTSAAKAGVAGEGNSATSTKSAALADNGRAGAPAAELRRAVEGAGEEALRRIGVSVAADGSVKIDSDALKAAFESNPEQAKETLGRLGTVAASASARQLSSSGAVGGAINRLTEKLGNIEQQQADYRARLEQSQQAVQEQDKRADQAQILAQQAFSFTGTGAYTRIFSS